MTQYYSVAETAKLLRKALKEAFPDVKFSVRSRSYSGGASIGVSWRDGPNTDQVETVAHIFRGSYFDGSIDYKGSRFVMIDGQMVSFGADYIHCSRVQSRHVCEKIAARYPHLELRINGTDQWGWGITGSDFDATRPVMTALHKHSDRLKIEKSATAAKVIYCGNDGYSDVGALAISE